MLCICIFFIIMIMCCICVMNFVNKLSTFPLLFHTYLLPNCHLSLTDGWLCPRRKRSVTWPDLWLTMSPISPPPKTLAVNFDPFLPPCHCFHLSFPPADQSIRKQSFKNTIISETIVVANQLTFTSSSPRRPRTWTWLRRWSAWCWKSSTLAWATLYTTTPTWCTRCSTRGSSLSSSGHIHPSRTSCRTWTRSVLVFTQNVRSEFGEAWEGFFFMADLW